MLDELPALAHVDAESVEDAVRWLSEYGDRAKVLAGGTDLLGLMKDRIDGPGVPLPDVLVNVKTIPGLADIEEKPDGGLRIGAAATLVDIERHPAVTARFAALAQAAAAVATTQIRAMGTIGGNLCQRPWCWYFRHPRFRVPQARRPPVLRDPGEQPHLLLRPRPRRVRDVPSVRSGPGADRARARASGSPGPAACARCPSRGSSGDPGA